MKTNSRRPSLTPQLNSQQSELLIPMWRCIRTCIIIPNWPLLIFTRSGVRHVAWTVTYVTYRGYPPWYPHVGDQWKNGVTSALFFSVEHNNEDIRTQLPRMHGNLYHCVVAALEFGYTNIIRIDPKIIQWQSKDDQVIIHVLYHCLYVLVCMIMFLHLLQDLAVEVAFPQCGICRLNASSAEMNEEVMSELEDGRVYHREGLNGAQLISGSQAEGLAMERRWGHPDSDMDKMHINGGTLGVYVVGGQQPRGKSCLEFRPEGCPAAYCKLEVKDLSRLKRNNVGGGFWYCDSCVHESDGRQWMNTQNTVRKMKENGIFTANQSTIVGPSAYSDNMGSTDIVQTLTCSGSAPELHTEFRSRPRGSWPPVSLIKYILQMPMLLVLVGHKDSPESEFKLQARMSWSHLELKLIQELPESVRQGYIACKYVIKRLLKAHRGQNEATDGRSSLCSYHLKVTLLHFLEKRPPSMVNSPFGLFLDLLHELDEYLKVGKLPHYFLAECNLLETMAADERGIARQVIAEILSDPLSALLTSPTDPEQIYGEVRPIDLAIAFQKVSAHPTREKSQKNLSRLLARVDERRREIFEYQRDIDKGWRSGRPALTLLVDTLKQIKWI